MRFQIFDVAHGFCALLIADNNNLMLFDAGHNDETGFRPSSHLKAMRCTGIERFFITNYDNDHVSDLPNIRSLFPISILHCNKTVSPELLRGLKLEGGPISSGLDSMIDMVATYTHPVPTPPEFPNIEWAVFHNDYPTFTDTNNLSLVTFIHFDGMGIVIPGDLEKAGWLALLKNASFRDHLARVTIFIASHHGRENGYCEEVFALCKPSIVIISDDEIQYDTQDVDYSKHAYGIPFNGSAEKRYVLTTRSDGMITIDKSVGSGFHITI